MKWLVEHDSHKEKKGDVFEGEQLPVYLVGKAKLMSEKQSFEVNTPNKKSKE